MCRAAAWCVSAPGRKFASGGRASSANCTASPCPRPRNACSIVVRRWWRSATGWLALFRLGDAIRPEASALIAALRADGRRVTLLTGDARPVAERVAQALGIDDVRAEVSPQGKHDFVAGLQAAGAVVAMVGDGINDAPVLAKAQVSVAMGGGAQLARTQADLVLLSENLDHLRHGYRLARRALRVIRQNLWWSFAYNFVALPLAMVGLVTPWMAGIGMSGSSLLVVMNSLRLQRPDNP